MPDDQELAHLRAENAALRALIAAHNDQILAILREIAAHTAPKPATPPLAGGGRAYKF